MDAPTSHKREAHCVNVLLITEAGFDPKAAVSYMQKTRVTQAIQLDGEPKLKAEEQLSEWVRKAPAITGHMQMPYAAGKEKDSMMESKRRWKAFKENRAK
ncbi:MAG: hypothetical protein Q9213_002301 [Squamulea squamosa]